jgi:hypothetical protein
MLARKLGDKDSDCSRQSVEKQNQLAVEERLLGKCEHDLQRLMHCRSRTTDEATEDALPARPNRCWLISSKLKDVSRLAQRTSRPVTPSGQQM